MFDKNNFFHVMKVIPTSVIVSAESIKTSSVC